MKKRLGFRTKKLLSLMMVGCLLLALAACGKDDTQGDSGLTAVTTPGAEQSIGNSVTTGTTSQTENGWDEAAILAEGYYNTEYNEYFVGGISFTLDAATKTAKASSLYIADTTEYYMPDEIAYEGVVYQVNAMENGVFADSDATKVRLSSNLTVIPESLFQGSEALTEIVIPEKVTEIGNNAFTLCSALSKITLPANLKKIGSEAFFGCSALAELTIPEGVTEIGESAFYECSLLREIVFPASLKKVPDEALNNCVCLETVVIPQGVSQIGLEVFWGCTALKKVELPDSVVLMGTRAFYDCASLEEVILPANLLEVDAEMFAFCESLTTVNASAAVAELIHEEMPAAEFEIVIR